MILNDKQGFFDSIRSMADGMYSMVIEKVYDIRSNPQNRYYWGVVIKAFVQGVYDTHGEKISIQEAHDSLKEMFNFKEIVSDHGEIRKLVKTTRKLNTSQFNEYIENCRRFIQEWFNIETPDPE